MIGEVEVPQSESAVVSEAEKAAPSVDECAAKHPVEKCETNDGAQQPQPEKSPKRPPKPQDNSFEKSKKWYNIGFMHRTGSSSNSRSANNKNSVKVDNRHSWHLNDSSEM